MTGRKNLKLLSRETEKLVNGMIDSVDTDSQGRQEIREEIFRIIEERRLGTRGLLEVQRVCHSVISEQRDRISVLSDDSCSN